MLKVRSRNQQLGRKRRNQTNQFQHTHTTGTHTYKKMNKCIYIYIYAQRPPQGLPFFEYKNQFNQFICKNKQTHHHYLSAKQMYLSGQTHQVTCKQNMSGLTSLLFHHSASDQSTKMHQAKKTKPKTKKKRKNRKNLV